MKGEVLASTVGRAVLAHGRCGRWVAPIFNVQMGMADGIADLLRKPVRRLNMARWREGDQAHGGQDRSHVNHIGLGNAAVKVAVRVSFLETLVLVAPAQGSRPRPQVGADAPSYFRALPVAVRGMATFSISAMD